MPVQAAAVEVDITPALPCEKPGWIVKIFAERIADPICAKILVLDDGRTRVAFVSLDVLSVRWPMAEAIRAEAEKAGIPHGNVMVGGTHTHTGPPASSPGLASKDPKYIAELVTKVGQGLREAVAKLAPANIGIGSAIESRVSFIRRTIMKDGTVRTHATPGPSIRCAEGVIDPEVGIIAIRNDAGRVGGVLVNFTCHPTHDGGEPVISAGWPGVLSNSIRQSLGQDVATVYLNGALGDCHHANPQNCDESDLNTKERVGQTLASTVLKALDKIEWNSPLNLAAARQSIQIPFRDIDGPVGENFKLRQRFASDDVYGKLIARLRAKKAKRDHVLAEVQAIRVNNQTAFVSLPCEPFTKIGLDIKSASPFPRTYVVGVANGMVGYVPTEEAFTRGGYETTLSMGTKLDPSAARLLTQTAIEQLRLIAK